MKRIDILEFNRASGRVKHNAIAEGINEIMDYLEKNLPAKNGKFYKCKNCDHVTGYKNDLDECCAEPDYEEYDE